MRTKRTIELRYSVANPVLNTEKTTEFMKEIKEIEQAAEGVQVENP